MALESLELEVASLSGVGTEYHVLAVGDLQARLLVTSGPTTRDLGVFPDFRAAVLEAVGRIEKEIENEIGAAEEDETPTTIDGLVAYFEAHPDTTNPAAPTPDLFDRLVAKIGNDPAQRIWTEALVEFDRKHAPEEFDDEEEGNAQAEPEGDELLRLDAGALRDLAATAVVRIAEITGIPTEKILRDLAADVDEIRS